MLTVNPVITLGRRKVAVDLPHLAFATAIVGWAVWFCRDAWISGPDVENLILIVPVTIAAVIFYPFVIAGCFGSHETFEAPRHTRGNGIKIAGTMVLLAGLVVAGPLIGFDVVSFVYMFAMLFFLGERRIVILLLVPLIFCAVVIYCFNNLLATPLPLYFLSGDA